MNFRTGPIEATERNANDIPAMVHDELVRFSGDTSRVFTTKDQREVLKAFPERYLGAFDETDRLVSFVKFNDWRRADQIAFESLRKQVAYKFDPHKEDHQMLAGNPAGIFALTSYGALSRDEAIQANELLLDEVISRVGHREIRMARFHDKATNDPAWWATNRKGFKDTNRFGQVAGVLQRLAFRPADAPVDEAA